MGMIPIVGRKSLKTRFLIVCMYTTLILLGATMVFPFMIMLTSSMANDYDYDRFSPLPRFLWDRDDLYVKDLVLLFSRYRKWYDQLQADFQNVPEYWKSWEAIGRDSKGGQALAQRYFGIVEGKDGARARLIAADYSRFVDGYPMDDTICPVVDAQTVPFVERYYLDRYRREHPAEAKGQSRGQLRRHALALVNREWDACFETFFDVSVETFVTAPIWQQGYFPGSTLAEDVYRTVKNAYRRHVFTPGVKAGWLHYLDANGYTYRGADSVFPVTESSPDALRGLWRTFEAVHAPASPCIPFALRAVWYTYLKNSPEARNLAGLSADEAAVGTGSSENGVDSIRAFDVAEYNRLAGTSYARLEETPFPVPATFGDGIVKIWRRFVETRYPLRLTTLRVTDELQGRFEEFLRDRYKSVAYLNRLVGVDCASWSDFRMTASPPPDGEMQAVWADFAKNLPMEFRRIDSSEIAYQRFLLRKYGNLRGIERAYGWNLSHIEEAFPPVDLAYTVTFLENESAFRFAPIVANYSIVGHFLANRGNAILVTIVLVALTIATSLTVNPLAAYALSRFNLRGQEKIILFMVATMAFPAMVVAIPAYLLMRDLGLLNTFFALILPSAASGMSIFILKGFFDSLPAELFEAATIDGAPEWRIFLVITLPLVKPILALNVLSAFVSAYTSWQWALIICQDKKMWTLQVWLYQASYWWSDYPWVHVAGMVVVSIPTLIVFMLCQRVIMRGIVLPAMK